MLQLDESRRSVAEERYLRFDFGQKVASAGDWEIMGKDRGHWQRHVHLDRGWEVTLVVTFAEETADEVDQYALHDGQLIGHWTQHRVQCGAGPK